MKLEELRHGTELLKRGFAKMQKGGVIMDVTNKDQALIERAVKAGVDAALVSSDDVIGQLESLVERYGLDIDPDMTRCTECNSTLREVTDKDMDKIRSSGEVPERLIKDHIGLWVCDKCGKVYWQGSHWRNILKTAEKVKNNENKTNQH